MATGLPFADYRKASERMRSAHRQVAELSRTSKGEKVIAYLAKAGLRVYPHCSERLRTCRTEWLTGARRGGSGKGAFGMAGGRSPMW